MVQLEVLSGRLAGATYDVTDFPCNVGRSGRDHIRIEEPGIWDRHLTLHLDPEEGVVLTHNPDALALVNDEAFESRRLRPGDFIDLGSLKLRFWMSHVTLKRQLWRERLVWGIIVGVAVLQIALLLWLL